MPAPIRRSLRLAVTAAAVVGFAGCARNTAVLHPLTHQYPPEALRADVAKLRSAIEEGDPTIHRMRTRREIDSIFAVLDTAVARPLRAPDFWREVTRAVAGLRDAHLTVLPSQTMFGAIFDDPGASIPLVVRVDGQRLMIRRNYLGDSGPREGSEVVTVNGMSAAEFLATCVQHVSVDAAAYMRAYRRLEREFEQTCAPAHGLPPEYALSYLEPADAGAVARTATVRAIPWSERRRLVRATHPTDTLRSPPGEFRQLKDTAVAILTLRTFVKSDAFDPARFLDSAFALLRATRPAALIVDLRGNTGGRDTYAARLFQHIAADTFTYYARRTVNRKRFSFIRGSGDWYINYLTFFYPPMRKRREGGYELRMAMDKPMRPVRDAYGGAVFLMVDGNTFSVGPEFAALFRHKQRGVILGEEMGTVESGGSGASLSLVLPHTQLIVNVPIVTIHTHLSTAAGIAQRGMMPDVEVRVSNEDLLAGRDPVRERTLRLALSGARRP